MHKRQEYTNKKSQRDTILETIKVTNGTYRKMFKKTRAPTEQNTNIMDDNTKCSFSHIEEQRPRHQILRHTTHLTFFFFGLVTNSARATVPTYIKYFK